MLASRLGGNMEPIDTIAQRFGLSTEEARTRLIEMATRGLVWANKQDEKLQFRLVPFVVGIYEAQLDNMDYEFAHFVEKDMVEGGIAGIMKPQLAIHRVVPAQRTMKSEWILPYDDVQAILLASKSFRVRDCICRVQQDHIGRRCDFPVRLCLTFTSVERPPSQISHENDISQDEALAILIRPRRSY